MKEYNILFYYYILLNNFEKNIGYFKKQIINKIKIKDIVLLVQISVISGLIASCMIALNKELVDSTLNIGKINETVTYVLVFLIGALTPLGTIFALFIFLTFISLIQVVEKSNSKRIIFFISVVSYLPVLLGSLINLIITLIFGSSSYGYTTLYGILRPENQKIATMLQEIDPFKIASVLIAVYFYTKIFDKSNKSFVFISLLWYVLSFSLILFMA